MYTTEYPGLDYHVIAFIMPIVLLPIAYYHLALRAHATHRRNNQ